MTCTARLISSLAPLDPSFFSDTSRTVDLTAYLHHSTQSFLSTGRSIPCLSREQYTFIWSPSRIKLLACDGRARAWTSPCNSNLTSNPEETCWFDCRFVSATLDRAVRVRVAARSSIPTMTSFACTASSCPPPWTCVAPVTRGHHSSGSSKLSPATREYTLSPLISTLLRASRTGVTMDRNVYDDLDLPPLDSRLERRGWFNPWTSSGSFSGFEEDGSFSFVVFVSSSPSPGVLSPSRSSPRVPGVATRSESSRMPIAEHVSVCDSGPTPTAGTSANLTCTDPTFKRSLSNNGAQSASRTALDECGAEDFPFRFFIAAISAAAAASAARLRANARRAAGSAAHSSSVLGEAVTEMASRVMTKGCCLADRSTVLSASLSSTSPIVPSRTANGSLR